MDVSAFIDWISVTHKRTGKHLPEMLPSTHQTTGGRNGYTTGKLYTSGVVEMINPERPDMGIHIVYSGKVLQSIADNYGVSRDDVLRHHTTTGGRISRVDFAVDIVDSGLQLSNLWEQLENGSACTNSGHSRTQSGNDKGDTVYVGSRKSRKKLVRCYDKAKEQGDFVSDYIRVELETRQDVARNAAKMYQDNGYTGDTITGMIKKFVDFPDYKLWTEIFEAEPMKIPVAPSGDGQTETWLLKQVAPALARVLIEDGDFMVRFHEAVNFHMYKILQSTED